MISLTSSTWRGPCASTARTAHRALASYVLDTMIAISGSAGGEFVAVESAVDKPQRLLESWNPKATTVPADS